MKRPSTFALLAASIAALPLLTGCAAVGSLLGGLDTPSASVRGVSLDGLTLRTADLLFDVEVSNPLGVDVPLVNLEVSLAGNGTPFLSSTTELTGSVPARSNRTVPLPVTVDLIELVSTVSGVRPGGVVDYAATMALVLSIPGNQQLRIPLSKEGQLPVPTAPEVSVGSIRWEELSLTRARGAADLVIANRNEFPVTLDRFTYGLSLAGSEVADGTASADQTFQPNGGSATVTLPVEVSPLRLGAAVFDLLSGRDADYRIAGTFSLSTPFGPLSADYGGSGRTEMEH